MKRIIFFLLCLLPLNTYAQKIEITELNNEVRLLAGDIHHFKKENKTCLRLYLEQYHSGTTSQYFIRAISWPDPMSNSFDVDENSSIFAGHINPGIIPSNGKLLIKTSTDKVIQLLPVLHYNNVNVTPGQLFNSNPSAYNVPIPSPETDKKGLGIFCGNSVVYYPITEVEIEEMSKGITKCRIEVVSITPELKYVRRYMQTEFPKDEMGKAISVLYNDMKDENSKVIKKFNERLQKENNNHKKKNEEYGAKDINEGF